MKPIRPTPITAAAVLLIAVGTQFLLAFVGVVITSLAANRVHNSDRVDLPDCCCCGIPLLVIFGLDFLRIGLGILYGCRFQIDLVSVRIAGFGTVSIVLHVYVAISIFGEMSFLGSQLGEIVGLLPITLLILFDSLAVLVAVILLNRNAEKYLEWQKEYTKPAEPSGYEEE